MEDCTQSDLTTQTAHESDTSAQPSIQIQVGALDGRGRREFIACYGDRTFGHLFDVRHAGARAKFIRGAVSKFGLVNGQASHLDDMIVAAAAAAEAAETAAALQQTHRENSPRAQPEPSPESAAAADRFLKNPTIFDELVTDCAQLGVVGEEFLAVTIYLIATSRILAKPLAGIVQSASASGKSFVMHTVLQLIPPEEVIAATDITPNALYFMEEDALRHKLIVVAERKHAGGRNEGDAANATLALREMLSSHKLTKLVPVKAQDGSLVTERIEREGPIAYLETTTQDQIFAEDATRMLGLTTDESPAQTSRILHRQADSAAGHTPCEAALEQIVAKHHAAQRTLEAMRVLIPFARRLQLPTHRVATRRLFLQLLGMIAVVALLRQKQKVAIDGVITADCYDYWAAYQVMAPILARTLAPVSDGARALYGKIHENLRAADASFCRSDCQQWIGLSSTEIRNRLASLVEAGLVEVVDGRKGVIYRYRISAHPDRATAAAIGLLTPEELNTALVAEGLANN